MNTRELTAWVFGGIIFGLLLGILVGILTGNSKTYQNEFIENWFREKAIEQGDNNLELMIKCDKVGGQIEVLEPTPLGFHYWQCLGNDGNVIMAAKPVTWYK